MSELTSVENAGKENGSEEFLDPILSGYLEDFRAGIEALRTSEGVEHYQAAKRMNEISADIRFRLGPPEHISPKFWREVAALLEEVATAIRPQEGEVDFRTKIRERAEILTGLLKETEVS